MSDDDEPLLGEEFVSEYDEMVETMITNHWTIGYDLDPAVDHNPDLTKQPLDVFVCAVLLIIDHGHGNDGGRGRRWLTEDITRQGGGVAGATVMYENGFRVAVMIGIPQVSRILCAVHPLRQTP
jgi:hypothetical protein